MRQRLQAGAEGNEGKEAEEEGGAQQLESSEKGTIR